MQAQQLNFRIFRKPTQAIALKSTLKPLNVLYNNLNLGSIKESPIYRNS